MLKGAKTSCQSDIFSLPVRKAQHLSETLVGVLFVNNLKKYSCELKFFWRCL